MFDPKTVPQWQRMTDPYLDEFFTQMAGLYPAMPMSELGTQVWKTTLRQYLVRQVFGQLLHWYRQNQGRYPNLDDITSGLINMAEEEDTGQPDFTTRPSYYRDLTQPLNAPLDYAEVDPESAEPDPDVLVQWDSYDDINDEET